MLHNNTYHYHYYRISSAASNERKKKVGRNIRSRDIYIRWRMEARGRERERRHAERKPMVLDDEARYHSGRGRGTAYGHTAAPLQLAAILAASSSPTTRARGGTSVPPAIISRDRGATGGKNNIYTYIHILYVHVISSAWKKWTHDGIHTYAAYTTICVV